MSFRRINTIVSIGAVLFLARPVHARDSAAGEALYRAARESAKKGDWETACAQFAESQRLDPAPGTLVNLADCEEHRGLITSAWSHFTEVQRQLKAGDARLSYAHEHAAGLETRIPRLTVKLQNGTPSTARVFRDEEELKGAALGIPLPVDPGAHVIVVKVGAAEARFPVVAVENKVTEITVSAPAETSPLKADATERSLSPVASGHPLPTALPPPTDASGTRTIGFVLVPAGGVGLAVGAITGLLALSNASKAKDTCGPSYLTCDPSSVEHASTGKTMATVSTVSFLAGGALLAGGLYLVLRSPPKTAPTTLATQAGLAIGPTGAALRGTF